MLDCQNEVLFYTKQLVNIGSIVNTNGEIEIAQALYTMIASFPYFKENPTNVIKSQTLNDELERYNVLAFVKGTKASSNRTVILMGHLDTVGIEDFTQLAGFAFHPDELLLELKKEKLPPLVKEQAESGDWMFGRGILDMKSGVASNLYLLKYYSEHPDELEGNLIFLAECDEEDSSNGILSAVKDLHNWKEEHHFEYIALVNSDFVSPRFPGDSSRYIYKGTVGKLLPSFFITGAETHVGSAFEGLDPNLIAAELTRQIDYNPELCNEAFGETTMPPVSLKQMDLKPNYTVQTALAAYVYYNFFLHSWTPKDVLEKMKEQARIAFANGLKLFEDRYKHFCKISGEPCRQLPWQPRVMTFEEMETELIKVHNSEYTAHMVEFKENLLLDGTLDLRMYAARVVEEAWKWMPDKSPAVIVFYSSLYSPRIEMTGETAGEQRLIEALECAVQTVQPKYEEPIVIRNFFPYISDMSFVGLSDDDEALDAAARNNPSWGTKFFVDYQEIRELNIPVVNIGPYGLDAHKRYERMEIDYSVRIVPNLTNEVIKKLLAK